MSHRASRCMLSVGLVRHQIYFGHREGCAADGAGGLDSRPIGQAALVEDVLVGAGQFKDRLVEFDVHQANRALSTRLHHLVHACSFCLEVQGHAATIFGLAAAGIANDNNADEGRERDEYENDNQLDLYESLQHEKHHQNSYLRSIGVVASHQNDDDDHSQQREEVIDLLPAWQSGVFEFVTLLDLLLGDVAVNSNHVLLHPNHHQICTRIEHSVTIAMMQTIERLYGFIGGVEGVPGKDAIIFDGVASEERVVLVADDEEGDEGICSCYAEGSWHLLSHFENDGVDWDDDCEHYEFDYVDDQRPSVAGLVVVVSALEGDVCLEVGCELI